MMLSAYMSETLRSYSSRPESTLLFSSAFHIRQRPRHKELQESDRRRSHSSAFQQPVCTNRVPATGDLDQRVVRVSVSRE